MDVNGEDTDEFYTYIKSACPYNGQDSLGDNWCLWSPMSRTDLVWNFEKFLLDRDGRLFRRYPPQVSPNEMEADIMQLLGFEASNATLAKRV